MLEDMMVDMPMFMGGIGLILCLFFMVVLTLLIILPWWFIFSKAGYSRWLSLLMAIPIVNWVMVYFLAFSTWPRQREL